MPRVKVGPAPPDRVSVGVEIARLRGFDAVTLRARWRSEFRRSPPPHLPRHLLFRMLAYRLQADVLGDLDGDSQRVLDRASSPNAAEKKALDVRRPTTELKVGTILTREWNGQIQHVAVLAEGFAWNGKTYPSLSSVALAITTTRWNGPRFFGLRDRPVKESRR